MVTITSDLYVPGLHPVFNLLAVVGDEDYAGSDTINHSGRVRCQKSTQPLRDASGLTASLLAG
jgi:hypothetical protein